MLLTASGSSLCEWREAEPRPVLVLCRASACRWTRTPSTRSSTRWISTKTGRWSSTSSCRYVVRLAPGKAVSLNLKGTGRGCFPLGLGLGWTPGQCYLWCWYKGHTQPSSSSLDVQGFFFPVRLKEQVQFTKYAPVQT